MEKEYFDLKGNTKVGPFTLDALKKEAITPDTSVHYSGLPDWVPARTLPELQALFAGNASSATHYDRKEPNYNTSAASSAPKSAPSAFEAAGNTDTSSAYNPNATRPPMPENYLVWAILSTIFCCIPLGIVSIIHSTKVSSAYAAGDYEGALKASKDAKKWAIWGAVAGGVFIVVYFIFIAIAAVMGMNS